MPVLKPSGDNVARTRIPTYLKSPIYSCYPRVVRPQLLKLPREYTKLHAQVMSKVAAHRANLSATARPSADGKTEFEHPALCLVCAAVLDAGGKGQCAAHTITCGGETGVYFLLQVRPTTSNCRFYFTCMAHLRISFCNSRLAGVPSAAKPWPSRFKRSSATRIIINNYY
jgi:hypothetical protein